jgi:hypothetical protein
MKGVFDSLLLSAALLGAFGLTARGADAEPVLPSSSICDLLLRKALTNGTDVQVFLRIEDGRVAAGLATGLNGLLNDVDCSGLAWTNHAIRGAIRITFGFDGFIPDNGKPLVCEYHLDIQASAGKLIGTFEGTAGFAHRTSGVAEGRVSASPDLRGYWVLDMQMENGRGTSLLTKKSWGDRVYPRLFLKDGRWVQSLIYGWGKRVQINYFESVIQTNDLRLDGKRLTGLLPVLPTTGPDYLFTFDGTVVGPWVGGRFQKRVGGKEAPGGPFRGSLQPMPARTLGQSLYYLELHRAVLRPWDESGAATNGLQLMAFSPCLNGRFGAGVAYSASFNHVYHDADASGLKLDGDKLTGPLNVTMIPDAYMPPDKKRVQASYAIDARVVDGRIVQGTYTGTFSGRPVSGPVFGELLDQPAIPEPVSINVKLEDGVNGGAPWFRRTYVNFVATQGHAESGGMSNNKGGWKGTFKKADVKFDGSVFTATIDGTVDETKGPETGAYTFKLTGRVVGAELVGTCDTIRDGKVTKAGTPFMGGFSPVAAAKPGPDREENP